MKKRIYDDDDGRVIANMDVDGMPYNSGMRGYLRRKRISDEAAREKNADPEQPQSEQKDTPRQTLSLLLNGVLAGLTVALIFGGLGFLFILFCVNVWLK